MLPKYQEEMDRDPHFREFVKRCVMGWSAPELGIMNGPRMKVCPHCGGHLFMPATEISLRARFRCLDCDFEKSYSLSVTMLGMNHLPPDAPIPNGIERAVEVLKDAKR